MKANFKLLNILCSWSLGLMLLCDVMFVTCWNTTVHLLQTLILLIGFRLFLHPALFGFLPFYFGLHHRCSSALSMSADAGASYI